MTTDTVPSTSAHERYEGRTSTVSAWRVIAVGAALGLVWGVLARGWMRLVAVVPEFSWSGTLFILVLATVAGIALGLVEALRRRGAGTWRVLAAVPAFLLFAGQGALMAPAAIVGGLALSGIAPRTVRVLAGAAALGWVVFATWIDLGLHYSGVGGIGLLLLCLALAAGWSVVFRYRDALALHTPPR
jgi:hypothetical protein